MNKNLLILLAIILGSMYYLMMSLSIPKNVNCSFSANVWTDIFAVVFGLILMNHNGNSNIIVNLLGVSIITEHVWQFVVNKI